MPDAREGVIGGVPDEARDGSEEREQSIRAARLGRHAKSCAGASERVNPATSLFDPKERIDRRRNSGSFSEKLANAAFEGREAKPTLRPFVRQNPLNSNVADAATAVVEEDGAGFGQGMRLGEARLRHSLEFRLDFGRCKVFPF